MPQRTTTKGMRAVHVNGKNIVQHTADDLDLSMLQELQRTRAAVQARAFDPSTLVEQARKQWCPIPELADAFARCTQEWPESEMYTHFLSPAEREVRWSFVGSIPLALPAWGTLLVDIIHDASAPGGHAIGGMEYLDTVWGRHIPVGEFIALMDQVAAAHDRAAAGTHLRRVV